MLKIIFVCCLFSSVFASDNFIVVSGNSRVSSEPDIVFIDFSMVTKDKSSLKAQKDNTKVIKNVTKGLRSRFGLTSKNIQTKNYSLRAKYSYPRGLPPVFEGMEIENKVSIKFDATERVGEILDFLTSQGISKISNIQFSISDNKRLKKEALKEAFDVALGKAKVLAKKSGLILGKVLSIKEENHQLSAPRISMMSKSISSSPIIESGVVDVSATLSVSFRLK